MSKFREALANRKEKRAAAMDEQAAAVAGLIAARGSLKAASPSPDEKYAGAMAKLASANGIIALAEELEKKATDDGMLAGIAKLLGASGDLDAQGSALMRDTLVSSLIGGGVGGAGGLLYGLINPSDPDHRLWSAIKPMLISGAAGTVAAAPIPALARKGMLPDGLTHSLLGSGVLSGPGASVQPSNGIQEAIRNLISGAESGVAGVGNTLSKKYDSFKDGLTDMGRSAAGKVNELASTVADKTSDAAKAAGIDKSSFDVSKDSRILDYLAQLVPMGGPELLGAVRGDPSVSGRAKGAIEGFGGSKIGNLAGMFAGGKGSELYDRFINKTEPDADRARLMAAIGSLVGGAEGSHFATAESPETRAILDAIGSGQVSA